MRFNQNLDEQTYKSAKNGYWYFAERNGTKFGATSGKLKNIYIYEFIAIVKAYSHAYIHYIYI